MRPTRDQSLMQHAQVACERSTCNRLHVGAIIAREGRMVMSGYNGPISGADHCQHEVVDGVDGCRAAVHAEANAISFAARYGCATGGAEMFVTHSPCVSCAQLIVQSGIVRVVYALEYRSLEGLDLLESAGIETYFACA